MGNTLDAEQIEWINTSGKEVIVIPDLERAGYNLVKIALDNNWNVSFPEWENNIKDASDAMSRYGRLWTLKSIIDNKTNNKLKIELLAKKYMK